MTARRLGGLIVLIDLARQLKSLSVPNAGFRAGTCIGLASLALLVGAGSVHDATAENETRTLSFHHTHSDEDLTITFKRDGRYDEAALKQLNHFLRDWRTQDETVMDRHLFDILWEVYRDVDGKQPIQIVSSYRSPATNAMLRHRSAHSGVARFPAHAGPRHGLLHPRRAAGADPLRRAAAAARRRRLLSDLGIALRASRHRQHPPLAAHDARSAGQGVPGRPHRACPDRRRAAEGL